MRNNDQNATMFEHEYYSAEIEEARIDALIDEANFQEYMHLHAGWHNQENEWEK